MHELLTSTIDVYSQKYEIQGKQLLRYHFLFVTDPGINHFYRPQQ